MTILDDSGACFIAKSSVVSKDSIPADVACIMVSYHTGEILFASIDAVLSQSTPPAELLLVDNDNTDEVRRRLDELAAVTPSLRIVRGQGNVGFAAACNLGASLCRAARLLFLNPDCLLPEQGLERLQVQSFRPYRRGPCCRHFWSTKISPNSEVRVDLY